MDTAHQNGLPDFPFLPIMPVIIKKKQEGFGELLYFCFGGREGYSINTRKELER